MSDLILHGHPFSSNTHRVRLLLKLLDLPFEERTVDLQQGAHLGTAFTALNDLQQVPVLQDGSLVLRESYAILIYLARQRGGETGKAFWPDDPVEQAKVAAWLFFTANELHNGVGLARNEFSFGIPSSGAYAQARARKALDVLERRLGEGDWLELDRPTLAELSVYPFAAVAAEARIPLTDYPKVAAWIGRLEALPRFMPMPRLPSRPVAAQ